MTSSVIRIFEIIIVCLLAINLEGKSLQSTENINSNEQQNNRIKRGYGHNGGNDFSSSIQLSSPVLQYDDSGYQHSSSSLDTSSHLSTATDAVGADPWAASGLSPGYEVWLEPSAHISSSSGFDTAAIHASSQVQGDYIGDLHASSLGSSHPSGDYVTNNVFSHAEPSSQLHTQISSSSSSSSYGSGVGAIHFADIHDHGISAISDNVDFNNVADLKSIHYSKSYGK